jgi:hypothetical protein
LKTGFIRKQLKTLKLTSLFHSSLLLVTRYLFSRPFASNAQKLPAMSSENPEAPRKKKPPSKQPAKCMWCKQNFARKDNMVGCPREEMHEEA